MSSDEEQIQRLTLQLAEQVAPNLDLQVLLDLSIGYSTVKGYKRRLGGVLGTAADAGSLMHEAIKKDFVPALTLLLSPQSSSDQTQGLYGLRKTAHCILSFLRVSPPTFVRHFSHSKHFFLAIAHAYNNSLASIATSYGGLDVLRNAMNRPAGSEADDWERIWVDTKVALIDAFHIILSQLLEDVSSAKGQSLGSEVERTFDIIFALLEQPRSAVSTSSTGDVSLIPFLNQSLLADYQQSYSLSKTLASILKHDKEKDARLDVLESTLAGLDDPSVPGGKEPGALKIVLRSYGIQQGINNLGKRSKQQDSSPPTAPTTSNNSFTYQSEDSKGSKGKGKTKASAPLEDPQLDIKVTQVLDVLPDFGADYIRLLLESDAYKGDPEQVLSALLEGNAPSLEALVKELEEDFSQTPVVTTGYDLSERRNVFDDQEMDVTQITVGKKDDELVIFRLIHYHPLILVRIGKFSYRTVPLSIR
jgi:activating signal cointegrator complex subunit 2